MAAKFQDNDVTAGWEEILFKDEYRLMLSDVQANYPAKRSIFVDYSDINSLNPDLGIFMLENPDSSLDLGEKVLAKMLPPSWDPADEINLRIRNLPKYAHVEVRQIRAKHLGKMVAVTGLVRKATLPKPRMTTALYRCVKCDSEIRIKQRGMLQREPVMCVNDACNRSALRFILDDARSEYIDTQKIEVQENPEGLRGGAQPERLAGFVEDDIAGFVTPGNRVTLNGIIRSSQKTERDKSTVFDIFMDVQSLEFDQHEYEEIEITAEDEIRIKEMSQTPNLMDEIIRSISPTIYGLEKEKEGVALQLFGGSHKEMDDGTVMRGDIHILMVGDPGVAKSQLLRYMSNLAPRGIYASGKSASAAGLCVSGDTLLFMEGSKERIQDLVEARMNDPEEYRPGIFRQRADGAKVFSMSQVGSLRYHPISYVWKIKTPDRLIKLTAGNGNVLVLTPETKLQAMKDGRFDWFEAGTISTKDMVATVDHNMRFSPVVSAEVLTEDLPDYVYDLTVDQSHSFVGSGFMIHNTAAAVKDDFGDGRWTLEAGALVLADKGLACIDELDKMSAQDRSSLHEAMESQRISVAKAGITATLQCRCSLLAAANPKYGRFDEDEKIAGQIDLPPALMSRFDLIFVMTDKPEEKRDRDITGHILNAHRRGQVRMRGETESEESKSILAETDDIRPVYSEEMIRKYVAYSKKIIPVMTKSAQDLIEQDYLSIRKMGSGNNASVPITARQLEAYVRLSEASARARLSPRVEPKDALRAIDMVRYYLGKIAANTDGTFEIDRMASDFTKKDRSGVRTVRDIITASGKNGISENEIISLVSKDGISAHTVKELLKKLRNSGEIYNPSEDKYALMD
ncbi:MAG: ATP-binding protein [Candidatus Methanomethylophilaceae archaeon]|jgi:replicative DNA helicase Mcm|nr:ATP-binding protein [Candidatus Methanomethylophilaceae archaeon]MDI9378960.1 ATP-binding protein [Candidatus Thermoplasmatota archaeon]MDD2779167.1 ATP-binding protein [Candidatus Methanomethylophilaceae archaeon]MDD3128599.1 ATP-binding protein [Candidatus Methanomethylophilaceae archaeon]MDD4119668.1 ATP-binding protein [Candidatus Methanomethylophilaceae archaeon]